MGWWDMGILLVTGRLMMLDTFLYLTQIRYISGSKLYLIFNPIILVLITKETYTTKINILFVNDKVWHVWKVCFMLPSSNEKKSTDKGFANGYRHPISIFKENIIMKYLLNATVTTMPFNTPHCFIQIL